MSYYKEKQRKNIFRQKNAQSFGCLPKDSYLCVLMQSYKVKSCSFHAGVSFGKPLAQVVFRTGGAASFSFVSFLWFPDRRTKKNGFRLSRVPTFFVPLRA